ncbi:hypothetical protein GXB81_18185 [Paraburkholderia sp. Ac-20336]|uniref:hypothetical protein n=1 Tax=Paraburkholderia sp. Ac-20336 TaxID=2703886 RepID=UPI00197E1B42|nr:hypothetical protein [Paraburkholderia sp. Ac-20336]MBN3804965.1 hypothetical protein [Paraburkholderia sp. Ac-20336]
MQIKLIPAVLLFLGSYFPLALILAVQDVPNEGWGRPICKSLQFWRSCDIPQVAHPTMAYLFIVVTAVSLVFFLWLLKHLNGTTEMTIKESKSIPNDLINYAFPYIVSFMGVELGSLGKVVGFGLFMIWLFVITYRSGQILMNPLLLAAGWQLYEVQADIEGNRRTLRALSRGNVVPGQVLRSCLVQGIYVLKAKKND